MATQYTAGLTTGQVLTAATMNSIGAEWVDYTPTLVQTIAVPKTVTQARYAQIQKIVTGQVLLNVTGAGSGTPPVAVGLPITARTAGQITIGTGFIYDANTNVIYNVTAYLASTTTMQFYYQAGSPWGSSPALTLANGDIVQILFTYEAA